ncbi:hypothetical protein Hanom_Chr03g00210881 [Helianthus anomalus]
MTEWPLLANSRARAFPSPLLTPVINTVFCPPPPFITTPPPIIPTVQITPFPVTSFLTSTVYLITPFPSIHFIFFLSCFDISKLIAFMFMFYEYNL